MSQSTTVKSWSQIERVCIKKLTTENEKIAIFGQFFSKNQEK